MTEKTATFNAAIINVPVLLYWNIRWSNIKKNKMKAEIYLIIKLFIINMNPQFFNINMMKPWKEQLNRIDTHKINRN